MSRLSQELLGQILDEHGPALVLYARQWCNTPDDVVQEAFVSLLRQPETVANPVGWLYRAVRNGAIGAARKASRRTRHEMLAAQGTTSWFEARNGQRLDAEQLVEAMETLPIEQRETVVARLWGGLGWEEIAQLTETSTSTAHRRFQNALSALREKFPRDE